MPEQLQVDFFYGNEMHEGTVTDLSCHGLLINTDICPPFGSDLNVVLVLGDEVYKLSCKVKRLVLNAELSCSLGVELVTRSENYCDFVAIVEDFFYRKSYQ